MVEHAAVAAAKGAAAAAAAAAAVGGGGSGGGRGSHRCALCPSCDLPPDPVAANRQRAVSADGVRG